MKTLATTLTLAAAACVLATTGATALAAKTPTPAAPAVGTTGSGKLAQALTTAAAAKTPAHYAQVHSGFLTALHGGQTRGEVSCPAGTVVWGGGAVIAGQDLGLNLNSSFPMSNGSGWIADVNNTTGSDGTFTVNAVCAKAPKKYTIVESVVFTDPAFFQATGTVACPGSTVVLGGGSLSNSGSFSVNINSTFPSDNGWRTDQNDVADFDTTFSVLAICGKAPKGYAILAGPAVDNPQGAQSNATVSCTAGHPLGGGAVSSSGLPQVDLNSTFPDPAIDGWSAFEDNNGSQGANLSAFVICA